MGSTKYLLRGTSSDDSIQPIGGSMEQERIDTYKFAVVFILFILVALLNGASCNDIDVRC